MKNYSILRKNGGLIGDGIRPLLYELEYRDIEAECSSIGAIIRIFESLSGLLPAKYCISVRTT